MSSKLLRVALAAAISGSATSIQFGSNGGHTITDPHKPNTRTRRSKKSPADRLVESARQRRAEGATE